MAYVISVNNNLFKIAANEQDKNDLNIFFPPAVAIDITDANFAKVKNNTAIITVSGDTTTITDVDTSGAFPTQDQLENYVNSVKQIIKYFIANSSNLSKTNGSAINDYYNTLDSFDFSTITFPLNKSWEEYCEDNSITYFHCLQIP